MAEEKPAEENKPVETKEYRSFEQRIFVDSGIKDFVAYTGKAFYGTVLSMCRAPTFARKIINKQTFFQREGFLSYGPYKSLKSVGVVLGSSGGIYAGLFVIGSYSLEKASEGNYIPLAILGVTNLAFLSFELGRFSKSKQEYLEGKARKMAESKQEYLEGIARKMAESKQENLEAEVQTSQVNETRDERVGAGGSN